jgi:hypothetical protein
MNVWETDPHMRGYLGEIGGMRVLPMICRNIRNIIYIYKNIYKKQIDNRNLIITANRNTLEHPGTFLTLLFRQCSGYPVFRNIATGLVNQAFQPFSGKSCSGLFRLQIHTLQLGKIQAGRGIQPFPFFLFRMFHRTDGHTHLLIANA